MIPLSVPEIEGGSPERDGGGEGLVWADSSSWILFILEIIYFSNTFFRVKDEEEAPIKAGNF